MKLKLDPFAFSYSILRLEACTARSGHEVSTTEGDDLPVTFVIVLEGHGWEVNLWIKACGGSLAQQVKGLILQCLCLVFVMW